MGRCSAVRMARGAGSKSPLGCRRCPSRGTTSTCRRPRPELKERRQVPGRQGALIDKDAPAGNLPKAGFSADYIGAFARDEIALLVQPRPIDDESAVNGCLVAGGISDADI